MFDNPLISHRAANRQDSKLCGWFQFESNRRRQTLATGKPAPLRSRYWQSSVARPPVLQA